MSLSAFDLRRVPLAILHAYGWHGLVRRAAYEAQLRSGVIRRQLPAEQQLDPVPEWRWPLRFDLDKLRAEYERLPELDRIRDNVLQRAERLLSGEMQFYGWAWHDVGWPPRWHVNPWTGFEYPRLHWSEIPDDRPDWGDIKDVWEMSRWGWTCLLARAYVLTDVDRYVNAWWEAVEDWISNNPPNLGVNWRCGQETSLRAIMLQFGLCTFGENPASTASRLSLAGGLLRASARRVGKTLHYAMSQRNNHAISESVFLNTLAAVKLLPQNLTGRARYALIEALDDQFYDDGWYAQSSVNYQRLAMHTLEWLIRVVDLAGSSPTNRLRAPVKRSRALLRALQDPSSGSMPNLGANDGALLFDLTTSDRMDFRPLLTRTRGPWSEEEIWLRPRAVNPRNLQNVQTKHPYHVSILDGERMHAVIRTHVGRHRLQQNDLLHLDVWIDGVNVLGDPGTYRYTAIPPWGNPFTSSDVHNTPCLARTAEKRVGRFLLLSMPAVEITPTATGASRMRVTNDGTIERRVTQRGDILEVVDEVDSRNPLVVSWNVRPPTTIHRFAAHTDIHGAHVHLRVFGDVRLVPSDKLSPRSGWISPHYGEVAPVNRFEVRPAELAGQVRCVIAPPDVLDSRAAATPPTR